LGRIERLVLTDDRNRSIGWGEKLHVHEAGLLHRAFSIFLVDGEGSIALQKRHPAKYHSGGLWANTCCGHPRPGEATDDAARRRLGEELGIGCGDLSPSGVLRYRAEIVDLVENELDHLLVTEVSEEPVPDPDEVVEWRFIAPDELDAWIEARPEDFTAWFPPAWRIVSAQAPRTPA
jgi:isopentenyl-diphosphate Delta-isomerase